MSSHAAPLPVMLVLSFLSSGGWVAVIWLAIRHAWLAPDVQVVPMASLIALSPICPFGKANFGWGA